MKAIAGQGRFFFRLPQGVSMPAFATADGIGRRPIFVPVMMNFGLSECGRLRGGDFLEARRTFHHCPPATSRISHVLAANRTGIFEFAQWHGVIVVLPDFNIPFSKPDCNPTFSLIASQLVWCQAERNPNNHIYFCLAVLGLRIWHRSSRRGNFSRCPACIDKFSPADDCRQAGQIRSASRSCS